jgi:hypothetical protein
VSKKHPLQRTLQSIFRETQRDRAMQSIQLAQARDMRAAKALATLHGVSIERDRDGYWVTLPSLRDSKDDPLEGNHFCVGGREVLEAVEIYARFIEDR